MPGGNVDKTEIKTRIVAVAIAATFPIWAIPVLVGLFLLMIGFIGHEIYKDIVTWLEHV